ncbi:MAG TPA: hypothetical protein VFH14_06440 [Gemmatimonadaceae bacterium]|nr:hypothetical protein [Gemmatimonadaceae bacterium]
MLATNELKWSLPAGAARRPTKDGEAGASLSSPLRRLLGARARTSLAPVRVLMKRSPTVYIDCERCGLPFEPIKGGLCPRCDRILCAADLHGDIFSRWKAALTGRAICVECRAKPQQ